MGKPMVVRVAERRAPARGRVVVATDDERISHGRRSTGSMQCSRARPPDRTDRSRRLRAAEARRQGDRGHVQGDEPLLEPALIREVAEEPARARPMLRSQQHAIRSTTRKRHSIPTSVKVVLDHADMLCISAGRRFPGHATPLLPRAASFPRLTLVSPLRAIRLSGRLPAPLSFALAGAGRALRGS